MSLESAAPAPAVPIVSCQACDARSRASKSCTAEASCKAHEKKVHAAVHALLTFAFAMLAVRVQENNGRDCGKAAMWAVMSVNPEALWRSAAEAPKRPPTGTSSAACG